MSRKKQPSYGEMKEQAAKIAAEMEKEKERLAGVMAKAFMNDQVAVKLGGCSDADLKRVVSMLAGYIDECLAKLDAEKQARTGAARQQGMEADDGIAALMGNLYISVNRSALCRPGLRSCPLRLYTSAGPCR